MSRMGRQAFLASKPNRTKQYLTRPELLKLSRSEARKFLVERGLIGPKIKSRWSVDIGEHEPVIVHAHTRSEARAELKRELGLKRLPPCLTLERVV